MKLKSTILLLLLIASMQPVFARDLGAISGKLIDGTSQQPLSYARVHVVGTTKGDMTDVEGRFKIENLSSGSYTLEFSILGYEKMVRKNVVVAAGQTTSIALRMKPIVRELDAVVIHAEMNRSNEQALLLSQQKAGFIKQSIGAQELSRQGVSSVAEGVQKMTGISKQKTTGLVVRGLSERYNFLTVNGLPMITGHPDKKIIPLPHFSTDIVRNINVYKTYNAELYGDFAGASVNIVTKDIPYKAVTKVKFGVSGNGQTTFQPFKIDQESKWELLGMPGENRNLPKAYGAQLVELGYASSPEESAALFDSDFNVATYAAPVNTSLEILHGNRLHSENDYTLGYYVGVKVENEFHTNPHMLMANLNTEGGYISRYEDAEQYALSTQKSALVSVLYEKEDYFKLKINNIYLSTTSNFTQEQFGYNSEASNDFFSRLLRFRGSTVNQTQLLGDWYLTQDGRNIIRFGTSYGIGKYKEPDRKVLYANGKGEHASLYVANSNEPNRYFADLDIRNINARLSYDLGIGEKLGEKEIFKHRITVGGDIDHIAYDYFNRVIRMNIHPADFPSNINGVGDLELNTDNPSAFIEKGFREGWLNYLDGSDASKFSKIEQTAAAAYFSYKLKTDKLAYILGIRAAYFNRVISYRKPTSGVFAPFQEVKNNQPFSIFPSVNLKYRLNEQSNFRLAASITNTRPRVREILPNRYLSGPFELITGNPEIQNSTNYNVDLKYEIFPEAGGVIAVNGFWKWINDPIETVVTPIAGGSSLSYANTEKASLYGIELRYETGVDQLLNAPFLAGLQLGVNTTVMFSEVTIDKTQEGQQFLTNTHRKLQGAAPYLINANLSYQKNFTSNWKSTFTLAYNTFGKRIYTVGGSNLGDSYQLPFDQLDFIWTNELGKFSFDVKVKNILNDYLEIQQTPTAKKMTQPVSILKFKKGIDFSLSVGYTF